MKYLYLPELASLSLDELAKLISKLKKEPKSPSRDRVLFKLKLLKELKNDQRSNTNRLERAED
jgi:hypothetical protein